LRSANDVFEDVVGQLEGAGATAAQDGHRVAGAVVDAKIHVTLAVQIGGPEITEAEATIYTSWTNIAQ
jgi:hypothetical protein